MGTLTIKVYFVNLRGNKTDGISHEDANTPGYTKN